MRKLDITPITDAAQMPLKRGSLQFLQDSYGEILAAILHGICDQKNYDFNIMYVLWGLINSGGAGVFNGTAGAVFFQGEVFLVDATNFSIIPGQVAILSLGVSQYNIDADPVTFTDTSSHNVHDIRKMVVSSGNSGSGSCDYSALSFCNFIIPPVLDLTAPSVVGGVGNAAQVLGVYPELEVFVPVNNNLAPIVAFGKINVGDVPGGGQTYTVVFGSALTGVTTYEPLLQLVSVGGSPHDDTTVTLSVIESSKTNTGFQFRAQEWTGGVQSVKVSFFIFKTS
jgi:hypothetical protein